MCRASSSAFFRPPPNVSGALKSKEVSQGFSVRRIKRTAPDLQCGLAEAVIDLAGGVGAYRVGLMTN